MRNNRECQRKITEKNRKARLHLLTHSTSSYTHSTSLLTHTVHLLLTHTVHLLLTYHIGGKLAFTSSSPELRFISLLVDVRKLLLLLANGPSTSISLVISFFTGSARGAHTVSEKRNISNNSNLGIVFLSRSKTFDDQCLCTFQNIVGLTTYGIE